MNDAQSRIVPGSVSNSGGTADPENKPSTGTLSITGNCTQSAAGALTADINNESKFDVLAVSLLLAAGI